MSILKVAKIGHPVLYKKANKVEKIPDLSINKLINDMSETMLDAKGIGLAAPQVHISKQIIIFRNPELEDNEKKLIEITVLINPKILNFSKETENDWEGCLSIPGLSGLVKRHSKITYEGLDLNGNIIKREAEGLHARVVQHEYDHIEGVLFTDKLSSFKKKLLSNKLRNISMGKVKCDYSMEFFK